MLDDYATNMDKSAALNSHEIALWTKHQSNLNDDKYKKKLINNTTIIKLSPQKQS